jgi:adenine specific DNA methylase Mod
MSILKRNNRFYYTRPDGYPQIRVYHKKGSGKKMPRYLLKCGCCDEKLEIYYDDEGLEINGVNGSTDDWREILLPLLRIEKKGDKLIAK